MSKGVFHNSLLTVVRQVLSIVFGLLAMVIIARVLGKSKASNLLTLDIYKINVDEDDRGLMDIDVTINKAKSEGKSYFIVLANMMTTMFGSVDNITYLTDELGGLHP
ncbi:hypothetical protein N9Y89_02365 [bacterium]|nr:hypothetical protein [bacterium]